MNRRILLISVTLMALSSCTPKEQTLPSSERPGYSSEESLSFSTETSSPIEANSSEGSSLSLSDDKQYCTVSIYQSYLPYEDAYGRKGIRFDTSIAVEKGGTIYRNDYERELLEDSVLTPEYQPVSGSYFLSALYWDPECKNFFKHGTKIESNCDLYYYMAG